MSFSVIWRRNDFKSDRYGHHLKYEFMSVFKVKAEFMSLPLSKIARV